MMRIAMVSMVVICILLSAYHPVAAQTSYGEANELLVHSALFGGIVVSWFTPLWCGGVIQRVFAMLLSTLVCSGLAFIMIQLTCALKEGLAETNLLETPTLFASGAMFAPLSLATSPVALLVWLAYSQVIGVLAKKARRLRAIELYRSKSNKSVSAQCEIPSEILYKATRSIIVAK